MYIQVLKSKLKKVKITDANVEYEGSLTLDPDLMEAAGIIPGEQVHVNAVYGRARLITYVIPGKRGTGQVEMNGGMANFFNPGDWVHVNCFMGINEWDLTTEQIELVRKNYAPIIVITDENNKIIE